MITSTFCIFLTALLLFLILSFFSLILFLIWNNFAPYNFLWLTGQVPWGWTSSITALPSKDSSNKSSTVCISKTWLTESREQEPVIVIVTFVAISWMTVGCWDGRLDGFIVGDFVGGDCLVGLAVSAFVGGSVGNFVGRREGVSVDNWSEGWVVGLRLGGRDSTFVVGTSEPI